MYRHEESGTSYDIRVKGQETDDAVKELLDGIVLKLEDEGNKDIYELLLCNSFDKHVLYLFIMVQLSRQKSKIFIMN